MSLITPQASRESTPALDATKTATQREQELLKELTTLRAQKAEEEEESNKNRLLKENNIDNTPPANPPSTEPANTPVTAPITEPVAPITAPVTAPVTAPEPNDSNDNFEIKIHDKPVPLTEPEKDFLVDHCETYFPHINGLDEKGKSIIFNILCPNFKAYHEDRHVFQLIFYAEFVLQTMDPAAAATATSRFVMEPPAWNFMSWGGKFDADIVNGRMKKAQERLNEYQTGIAYIHKSKVLSSAEIDFIRSNEFKTYFPGLLGLDDAPKIWMYKTCNEFKENNPRRDLFEYLLFAEYSLLSEKSPLYRGDAIAKFVKSPKALDAFDWGNVNQDAVKVWEGRMSAAREALAKFRANSKESSDSEAALYTSDSEAALYNSEERRAMRAQFHGKGDAEANRIVIKDPETGKDVIGEILGRHPLRKNWLALALPSNNEEYPTLSRGHYIDGSKGKYEDAFNKYVNTGANITLSVASNKEQLDGCRPDQFELNLVLVMPWGKGYRYAGYGIPHYKNERDFMVYSKALLASHKEWGLSSTMEVLHGHMVMAGQTIKGTGPKAIKAKSWQH